MERPWFNLDPNNLYDRWWLYSSIIDTKKHKATKFITDIQCYLVLQEQDMNGIFYRITTWYKDDPNRYQCRKYDKEIMIQKKIQDMHEGDIVDIDNMKFKIYNCRFSSPLQINFCKILERIIE